MMDSETPGKFEVDVARAIEALVQVQAFVAGRLYAELVDAGLLTDAEAAERLEQMAGDIESMNGPEPVILRAVALPMGELAAQFREGKRPRLQLVAREGTTSD